MLGQGLIQVLGNRCAIHLAVIEEFKGAFDGLCLVETVFGSFVDTVVSPLSLEVKFLGRQMGLQLFLLPSAREGKQLGAAAFQKVRFAEVLLVA